MLREVGGLGGGTRGVGANIGSGGGTRSRPHNGHESHKPGAPYFTSNTKKLHHSIPRHNHGETCAGVEGVGVTRGAEGRGWREL